MLAIDSTIAVYFCVLASTSTLDKSNVSVSAIATVLATHTAVDSCWDMVALRLKV